MTQSAQQWNIENNQIFASFVPQLGQPLLNLLQPKPKELVLDLGCGYGALTEKLVQAGCEMIAVDASPEMVKAACRLRAAAPFSKETLGTPA